MSTSAPAPAAQYPPAIVVVGPTAGGKSDLAVRLALGLPGGGECINADSMQVYRGMDIGTAKPSMAERRNVPHHLIDIADPQEAFTLERWHAMATAAVDAIRSRGRWPVLVGGTNLYIQTFLFGLLNAPGPDAALRAELDALDEAALRSRLEAVDPDAAQHIHANDRRRTIRALEVAAAGEMISSLQTQWTSPPRTDALLIGLQWPVETINRRINERVRAMVDRGLVEEVRSLVPSLGPQAAAALGYKQVLGALDGGAEDLNAALEQVKIRTRRFAKGQRTWLRRFQALKLARWLDATSGDSKHLAEQSLIWISQQACGGTISTGPA